MNTTVKIPVELSGVEAQVKFLKDALNNVKPDTSGYKDLSRVLATIQREFDAIKAAANGSFGSQSQINAFSKKVQDLGNQMSLFATKFEDLGDKSFKTDFLPDSVVKNLKDMTTEMNNLLKSMAQLKTDAFSKALGESENAMKSLASLKMTGKEDPAYIMNKLDIAIKKADGNIAKTTQDLATQSEQVKTLRDEYDALNAAKNEKQNENLGLNNAVQAKTLELSKQIAANEQNRQKAIAAATKSYDEQIAKLTALSRAVGKGGHMTNEQRQSNALLDGAFSAGKGDFMSNRENIATFMKTNFHIDDATVEQIKAGNKAQVETIVSDILTQVKATREKVIQATAVTDIYDSEALQSTKNEIDELEQKLARVRTEAETLIRDTATKEREVNAAADQEARLQNNLRAQQQLRESYAATRVEVEAAAVTAQEAADGSGIAQQIDALRNRITELESEIAKLNQEQKNTVNATARSQDGINNMGNAALAASAKLAQLEAAQSRLNNIKTAIASWLGFNQIINITRTTVRNMINHIKELDDVMTEIAVVTDFTQDDLWKQMDTYASIAREYGVSIKGVYEVSQLYYQQGALLALLCS